MNLSRRGFLLASSAAVLRGAEENSPVAETACGKVRGTATRGIKTFKGVAYGASTAGMNRFMPPMNPEPWTDVREALRFGLASPQTASLRGQGEDCLVLNVWTPALKDGGKRPVMLWCHGGGFTSGSGGDSDTDGTNLARRGNVVVLTINHRLNVLGFTYLGAFGGAEFEQSGDVGMLDIVQALKWVRENIEQFGGDPNNVTVFGQSGGGRKVGTLLSMPSAKGLFQRAVIESGPATRLVEREQAVRTAERLLARLQLEKSDVREMQKMPLDRIMAAYFEVAKEIRGEDAFAPVVNGSAIPRHPFYPTASDVSADVPVMIGSTRTEVTLLSPPEMFELDEEGMRGRVQGLLGDKASRVIAAYHKANPGATPPDLYFLIASDYRYSAPIMEIAERRAALDKGPVYLYYFRWETPVEGGILKSPHTIEVPFVFDNVRINWRLTGGGDDAVALADKVSDTWIAFARTGDPNNAKIPHWPKFDAKTWPTMVFNNAIRMENDPIRAQRVAMFEAISV